MGRSFEDGFIQGAMGGAVGGFIGYMIGLGLKGLSNDQGNGTASNESPASSEDLNFEDHLPDRGPGGVGYGGPGRTQKRVLKQAREYRNTKVVKSKPVVKASVSTPSLLVTASLAASYLMDALAAAAIPLAISPTVLILPLALLSGDTPIRHSKGGKKRIWSDQYGYPPNIKDIDWSKGNQELADKYSNNDPNKGPGNPHIWLIKWFRDHSPAKK